MRDGVTSFVFLKGRQLGITTIFILIDFMYAFEHPGLLGTMIIHEEKALDKWRSTLEAVYESLPKTIVVDGKRIKFKPEVIKHNRNILLFSNGSSFSYLTAGTGENKQGGLGRSQASNFVHGTETAFYGNDEDLKEFQSSVSDIYPYRLQVHESTANAFNHFYDRYKDGQSSPTVRSVFVGWWRDERKQFHMDDARFAHFGKDRPSRLELGKIRAVKQQYDFDISMQQVAWYRWKLADEFQGDQTTMDQEFPFTDDEAFQSTGSKYFTAPVLNDVTREARKHRMQAYRYKLTRRWDEIEVLPFADPRAELKVWEQASRFGVYVLACDPAYGSSDQADNSVIQVWRCYAECMIQVAEWASREASTHQVAWIIAHLAGFYGRKECTVILEVNGPGKAVLTELQHVREHVREIPAGGDNFEIRNCLSNMRYYFYTRVDTIEAGSLAYGMVTTDDLKRMVMAGFKSAIELHRVHPRSLALIDEMRTLVNTDGSIAADGGKNDDRVMTGALAHEAWRKWLWARLRGEGHTRAYAEAVEARGGDQPIDRLLVQYLKTANIKVPS